MCENTDTKPCRICGEIFPTDSYPLKDSVLKRRYSECHSCKKKMDKVSMDKFKKRKKNKEITDNGNHYRKVLSKFKNESVHTPPVKQVKLLIERLLGNLHCDRCGVLLDDDIKFLTLKYNNGKEKVQMCCSHCFFDFRTNLKRAYKYNKEGLL